MKDGDDATSPIRDNCLVAASVLGVGLVWASARGWQLTLVGFACICWRDGFADELGREVRVTQ
jgi:hypothetical protein